MEEFSHPGHVVQRENELALQVAELFRKIREVIVSEIESVQRTAPVRRIQIEQRGSPVKPFEDIGVRQTLNLNPLKSLVCIFKELGKASGIETRRSNNGVTVSSVTNQACESVFLEIEKAGGALDIGQCVGVFGLEECEPFPADEDELEIPEKFLMMALADPKEVHHVAVQVVQDLDGGRVFVKEHLRAASKRFNVRRVLRKDLDDLRGDAILPSYICERSDHCRWFENGGPWRTVCVGESASTRPY
ncbi:MAG TPA: hypothetical protein VGQ49_13430 [Bryobacteraceae bacterium]|jgi:hypothetical protein|nr:hypothetical protein [Bryobacteraceae bacterium]